MNIEKVQERVARLKEIISMRTSRLNKIGLVAEEFTIADLLDSVTYLFLEIDMLNGLNEKE